MSYTYTDTYTTSSTNKNGDSFIEETTNSTVPCGMKYHVLLSPQSIHIDKFIIKELTVFNSGVKNKHRNCFISRIEFGIRDRNYPNVSVFIKSSSGEILYHYFISKEHARHCWKKLKESYGWKERK